MKADERDPPGVSCQTRKQQQTSVQAFRVESLQRHSMTLIVKEGMTEDKAPERVN